MLVAERLRSLRIMRLHDHRVALRQAHNEVPNLLFHATQNRQGLTEVRLRVA